MRGRIFVFHQEANEANQDSIGGTDREFFHGSL